MKKIMTGVFAFSFMAIAALSTAGGAYAAKCENVRNHSKCRVTEINNKQVKVEVENKNTTVGSVSFVVANSGNQQKVGKNSDDNKSDSGKAEATGTTIQEVNKTVIIIN